MHTRRSLTPLLNDTIDCKSVPWYFGTMKQGKAAERLIDIQRVQTGVRLEKRLLKILKAMAEYSEISLGDLIEGICLHAFDGKLPFDEKAREKIGKLKEIYELDLDASASHRLRDQSERKT